MLISVAVDHVRRTWFCEYFAWKFNNSTGRASFSPSSSNPVPENPSSGQLTVGGEGGGFSLLVIIFTPQMYNLLLAPLFSLLSIISTPSSIIKVYPHPI